MLAKVSPLMIRYTFLCWPSERGVRVSISSLNGIMKEKAKNEKDF